MSSGIIKSIYGDTTPLKATKQEEFELMQDIYTGSLEAAASMHNAYHPIQVEYRTSFVTGSNDSPFHVLTTEICVDGTWTKLSRHVERTMPNDRMTPRLVLYRKAFAGLGSCHLMLALSNLISPEDMDAAEAAAELETPVIPISIQNLNQLELFPTDESAA